MLIMTWRLFTIAVMFAMIAGLTVRGEVAAQETPETDPAFDYASVDGLTDVVSRTYSGDLSSLYGDVDLASGATPDVSALGTFSISSVIFRFEDDGKAEAGFGTITDFLTEALQSGDEEVGELNEVEVDGFGDNTRARSGTIDIAGMATTVFAMATQDGEYVYYTAVVSFAGEESAQDAGAAFTTVVKDRDAGDGAVDLRGDGTSSGGLFDKYPEADDEVVANLTADYDEQLYPEPAS